MPTSLPIAGRVALVTGANRGIGRALVEALLARGAAKVYAAARKPETLADLVAADPRVVPLALDVTHEAQVGAAAALATDVDLLVNNAGIANHAFGGFDDAAWLDAGRQEYEVNVLGTLRVSQAFAPALATNGGGAIVNIASIAGLVNMPLFLAYSTSKAALHSLTQGTRLMLGARGTGVFGVYPGPVDTDMAEQLTFPKTSAADVAHAILDGIEQGIEEIFPDPMAAQLGSAYAGDPKALERQVAAMV